MKRFAPVLVVFFFKYGLALKSIIYLLWLRSKTHRYFQGTMFHLRMMSESVPTARFQQPLHRFEASTKKISTMSSFPASEVLSPVCVGCHPQPSELPADWDQGRFLQPAVWVGCLPSPLTCAAQKGGWIMEQCSQEGFFFILSQTSVCMELLQSPTQQVGSPKSCPTTCRNTDVQIRFRCLKCIGMNNLAVVEAQNVIPGSCLDTIWVIGVRQW